MTRFKFTNKQYDRLKRFALVYLPAFGALYFGLGQIWGFPSTEQVVGTITVIDTFLGVIVRGSNKKYNADDSNLDGDLMLVNTGDDGAPNVIAGFNNNPGDLKAGQNVTLRVKDFDPSAGDI